MKSQPSPRTIRVGRDTLDNVGELSESDMPTRHQLTARIVPVSKMCVNHQQGSGGIQFGKRHGLSFQMRTWAIAAARGRQLRGLFFCEMRSRHRADNRDAREEDHQGGSVAARDFPNPEQDIADDYVE